MMKPIILIMSLLGLAFAQFGPGFDTPNNCIGQGAGSCQFTMIMELSGVVDPSFAVALYDHECNVIGFTENVYVGTAIDSQLPYTVDVTTITEEPYGATFNYAGGSFGTGFTTWATWTCSDGVSQGFRAAFPCPGF
ncbi:hypothetical protein V1505DRAFT_420507 [Lipomyces doorenjongii]